MDFPFWRHDSIPGLSKLTFLYSNPGMELPTMAGRGERKA